MPTRALTVSLGRRLEVADGDLQRRLVLGDRGEAVVDADAARLRGGVAVGDDQRPAAVAVDAAAGLHVRHPVFAGAGGGDRGGDVDEAGEGGGDPGAVVDARREGRVAGRTRGLEEDRPAGSGGGRGGAPAAGAGAGAEVEPGELDRRPRRQRERRPRGVEGRRVAIDVDPFHRVAVVVQGRAAGAPGPGGEAGRFGAAQVGAGHQRVGGDRHVAETAAGEARRERHFDRGGGRLGRCDHGQDGDDRGQESGAKQAHLALSAARGKTFSPNPN